MKALKVLLSLILILGAIFGGLVLVNQQNEKAMNEYIDSFAKVEYENQLTPSKGTNFIYKENNFQMQLYEGSTYFTTDGDFNVMHLTDIHIGGGFLSANKDKMALNAVAAMITAEKPDLVVVTGDISFAVPWAGTINNAYAHRMFIRLMENLGVYWTVTLGNHDSENYNYHNRSAVAGFYASESLKYCLFDRVNSGIFGEGNHVINVKNSQGLITKSLFMMDSNSYTDDDPLGISWVYDNIHEDQIQWYKDTVTLFNKYNKSVLEGLEEKPENIENFETIQSMLFIHIPLMEVRDAALDYLEEKGGVEYLGGAIGESDPYVYPSEIPEEMFETMLELGSTKAMFYGHDHLNNIVLNYKGVTMSYGYSIDYFAYSGIANVGSQRGCTMIICKPDTSFEINHENYYQDKYAPLYEKEVVDLTN